MNDIDMHNLTLVLRDIIREEVRSTHMPVYLGSKAAGAIAGVTPATIRIWAKRGELRSFHAGNDLRVRLVDLESYLARRNPENNIDLAARARAIMAGDG